MKRIEVTCAIVVENGKVLACQRGLQSDHPMEWEFPGGKIETGETAEQCIVREIQEELSLTIQPLKRMKEVDHNYANKKIRLIPFLVEIVKGDLYATEHHAICWHDLNRFDQLNWSDADRKIFLLNETSVRLSSRRSYDSEYHKRR